MAPKAATDAPKAPSAPRQSAVIAINVDSAVSGDDLAPASRRTQWDQTLDQLYSLTEAGNIPTNEDGTLKFVQIGHYKNVQGVSAQMKAFRKRELDKTYEFRGNGVDLYARVILTPDADTGE